MKIVFTQTALAEIDEIFAYVAAHNQTAARGLIDRIRHAMELLAEQPEMAPVTDEPETAYLVYYTIHEDRVGILHVWHGARRRPWEDDQ